jgi:hypothetical protein
MATNQSDGDAAIPPVSLALQIKIKVEMRRYTLYAQHYFGPIILVLGRYL